MSRNSQMRVTASTRKYLTEETPVWSSPMRRFFGNLEPLPPGPVHSAPESGFRWLEEKWTLSVTCLSRSLMRRPPPANPARALCASIQGRWGVVTPLSCP